MQKAGRWNLKRAVCQLVTLKIGLYKKWRNLVGCHKTALHNRINTNFVVSMGDFRKMYYQLITSIIDG